VGGGESIRTPREEEMRAPLAVQGPPERVVLETHQQDIGALQSHQQRRERRGSHGGRQHDGIKTAPEAERPRPEGLPVIRGGQGEFIEQGRGSEGGEEGGGITEQPTRAGRSKRRRRRRHVKGETTETSEQETTGDFEAEGV
jgi:hypothetical protein